MILIKRDISITFLIVFFAESIKRAISVFRNIKNLTGKHISEG